MASDNDKPMTFEELVAEIRKGAPGAEEMKWKVVIVGPTGTVYKNTNALKLLYPFPTREEAEAHADCFRSVMKVSLCDERGNLTACGAPFGAGTNHNK